MLEYKKKILGSGTTTLIISNEEIKDIREIVEALEDSNILLNGVTKTIKNETKEQKEGFLSMLFINRKRNYKSWRSNYKSWLLLFN